MSGSLTSFHLGALLTESGLINQSCLDEALALAQKTGLPVGRMLIMIGNLKEQDLQSAVQAQSLLKDGLVELEQALQALRNCAKQNIPFEQALHEQGWWPRRDGGGPNKLGELLLEAGIVDEETLKGALSGSFSSGLPLGRFLVLIGAMPAALLSVALNAQVLIRDGKVSRQRAVEGLKAARLRLDAPLEKGLFRLPSRHTIRLGELFVLAGLVSETDLMNALELGLLNQQPIGQVMIAMSFIDEAALHTALKLQDAVSQGYLRPLQAARTLMMVCNEGMTLQDAIEQTVRKPNEPEEQTLSLRKFLKMVGSIDDLDVERAISAGLENTQVFGRMLLVAGSIDEPTLQAAMRCDALVKAGLLTLEQACIAFKYSQQRLTTVDEVLQDLGWIQRIAAQLREQNAENIDLLPSV